MRMSLISVKQAEEVNVIAYRSYAYVDVAVAVADQFAPTLSTVSGTTTGFISEAADVGDLIQVTNNFNNNFMQLRISDADYVRVCIHE